MNILVLSECLYQTFVAGDMRHDSQFDLGVIGRHDEGVALSRDKSPPDRAADLRPNGDVLKVRIAGGKPSRGGDGLVERRVYASRRADQRGKRIDVRRFEFGQLPVVEEFFDNGVKTTQGLKHIHVG